MLIQGILIFILFLALTMTWRRAHQGVITRRDGLVWSLLWIGAAFVVASPQTASVLAHVVGIGRGSDLILYSSVIVLFLCIFKIFVLIHELERKLTQIVREEALRDLPKSHD